MGGAVEVGFPNLVRNIGAAVAHGVADHRIGIEAPCGPRDFVGHLGIVVRIRLLHADIEPPVEAQGAVAAVGVADIVRIHQLEAVGFGDRDRYRANAVAVGALVASIGIKEGGEAGDLFLPGE